jgi:hypothetical protein
MSTRELTPEISDFAERPVKARSDAWKPTAIGAALAAFVFAAGIGWLARERQKNLATIGSLQGKLKTQLADQEALQRRLYDQNRELATLSTRVRERDTRLLTLQTKLTITEKAAALAVKEREVWRARAAQPSLPVMVAPTPTRIEEPAEKPRPRRKLRTKHRAKQD